MKDYDLYYWPVPFRGQFIRTILAHAGKTWDEHDAGAVSSEMEAAPGDQKVPFMGPPMIVDRKTGFTLAEMPAIALYLGETLDLLPDTPEGRALSLKIVCDANDVIDELTIDGGREMWTAATWRDYVPRLKRWMTIWESEGQRNGLTPKAGHMAGQRTGIADIVTATLWTTMGERFPPIAKMIEETAPLTWALSQRVMDTKAMHDFKAWSDKTFGDAWCGGQIEASLRKVVLKS